MRALPPPVQNLIDAFSRLPGVGPKTAARLAFYLLKEEGDIAKDLAEALTALKLDTAYCKKCHNITLAGQELCEVCEDSRRDDALICVVEEPSDVIAIERTGVFIEGIGPEQIKFQSLLERLQKEPVREVIIATNPTMEGDATALYLQQRITPLGIKVSRLARGLPVGGDIEYADQNTLQRALSGRQSME